MPSVKYCLRPTKRKGYDHSTLDWYQVSVAVRRFTLTLPRRPVGTCCGLGFLYGDLQVGAAKSSSPKLSWPLPNFISCKFSSWAASRYTYIQLYCKTFQSPSFSRRGNDVDHEPYLCTQNKNANSTGRISIQRVFGYLLALSPSLVLKHCSSGHVSFDKTGRAQGNVQRIVTCAAPHLSCCFTLDCF